MNKINGLRNPEASGLKTAKLPSSPGEVGSFAERLKMLIGSQSVRSFASECNLSDGVVRQYIAGKSEPGLSALLNIARARNVEVAWLANGEEPMRRDKNAVLYERAEGLKDKDLSAEQLAGEAITIARSAMDTGDMNVNLIVTIVKNMTADRTPNEKLEINAAIMLALAEARKRQDAQRNQS